MTLCCIIMPKRNKSRQKQEKPAEESEEQEKPQQPQPENKTQFSLYDLLELTKAATPEEIKKQYRKLVLQYHPDKNRDDPNACEKFQKLKEAYDILIDADKRKEYDETGRVGQQFSEESFQSAYQYFRSLYKKVTPQDIIEFEKEYREGPMEQQDLLNFYRDHDGNMVKLIESIPLSKNQDIPRFIAFFQRKIEEKVIPRQKAFDKTKKKVRLLKDEQDEWEDEQKQEQEKGLEALMVAIRGKNSGQKDFIASLEEKYGVGKKKKVQKQEKPRKDKQ